MNRAQPSYLRASFTALGAALLILSGVVGCGPKAAPPSTPAKPKAAAKKTLTVTSTNSVDDYTSVFEDLLPPKGRDPFYPSSHRREPVPAATTPGTHAAPVNADSQLILKAILHTRTHSQAVINNEILEPGEEGQVRIPGGKVRVRCLEVGVDYVLVQVAGDAGPKRLTMSKKND